MGVCVSVVAIDVYIAIVRECIISVGIAICISFIIGIIIGETGIVIVIVKAIIRCIVGL